MKYVGNSSPCWTIPKRNDNVSQRHKEVLSLIRKCDTEVGPGTYDPASLPDIRHPVKVNAFSKSPKFSDQRYLDLMKPSHKKSLGSDEEAKHKLPAKLARKHSFFHSEDGRHYFTKAARTSFEQGKPEAPGPGTYELAADIKKNKAPHHHFGYRDDESAMVSKSTSPDVGPGSYLGQRGEWGKGVAFNRSKRVLDPVVIQDEGGGEVEKSRRLRESKENEAGPQVNCDKKRSAVGKSKSNFAKASRNANFRQIMLNAIPGPGQYTVPDGFKPQPGQWQPRAFSMAKRLQPLGAEATPSPGPANYDPKLPETRKSPGFVFGKSGSVPVITTNDPGDFIDRTSFDPQGNKDENVRLGATNPFVTRGGDIGRALRLGTRGSCSPGPAQYTINTALVQRKMPEIKIKKKCSVKNYKFLFFDSKSGNQPLTVNFEAVDPQVKGAAFGKGKRDAAQVLVKRPGEGVPQFDTRLPIGTGGFSFGSEPKSMLKKQELSELGPGFYELKQTFPQPQPWIKVTPKFEFYGNVFAGK